MTALDILERKERERLSRLTFQQAHDPVNRGLYNVAESMAVNTNIQTIMRELILADARNETPHYLARSNGLAWYSRD